MFLHKKTLTTAVAQSVRAFASYAKGWVFQSQLRQILVVKRGSNSPAVKCPATVVSVTGPRRLPL